MSQNNQAIAIIDNDSHQLHRISQQLIRMGFQQIHPYSSLSEFVTSAAPVDILICDICLNDGVRAFNEIYRYDIHIPIIFLTSYTEFSREAYGPHVIGFVDKANIETELPQALSKASRFISNSRTIFWRTWYETTEISALQVESIRVEAHRLVLTTVYGRDRIELTESSLKTCFEKLNGYSFYRIGRKAIVNLNAIQSLDKDNLAVKMLSGDVFKIPRRVWTEFYQQYLWRKYA